MYSLLIDTHDKLVSYVLYNDGKVVDQVQLESNMRHSEIAMPSLIEILKKNNLEIKDIKEILVVIGPGSFTGVRIGVVIAKTTAYLLNIPIKAITSIDLKVFSNTSIIPGNYFVEEKNGYFIGKYDESGKNIDGISYIGKDKFDVNNYVDTNNIDYENIYKHSKSIEYVNPHLINPLYVKQIEVLK